MDSNNSGFWDKCEQVDFSLLPEYDSDDDGEKDYGMDFSYQVLYGDGFSSKDME